MLGEDDSFAAHIADTVRAGAGLCHELAVEICVKEAPARIKMLRDVGARFDRRRGARSPTRPTSTCTSRAATARAASPTPPT